MASEQQMQELAATVTRLNAVDSVKLLREDLGVESLDRVFVQDLDKIKSLTALVQQHASTVHDAYVGQARSTLDEITNEMEAQAARPSAEYINQREAFLNAVRGQVEEARCGFQCSLARLY